jgi:preprotein translocase subunit SecE
VSNNPLHWAAQSREYLNEVQVEFKKVTWPTQKETVAGTVGVLFIVAIVSIGLFFVDWGLAWIMSTVLP